MEKIVFDFKQYCKYHKQWVADYVDCKEDLVNDYMWQTNLYGEEIFNKLMATKI